MKKITIYYDENKTNEKKIEVFENVKGLNSCAQGRLVSITKQDCSIHINVNIIKRIDEIEEPNENRN